MYRSIRRALNGVELPRAADLAGYYARRIAREPGPIGGPEFYNRQMWELAGTHKRVKQAPFEHCSAIFYDARGDALKEMVETDFDDQRKSISAVVLKHMRKLGTALDSVLDTSRYQGQMLLCNRNDNGGLVVGEYRDEYISGKSVFLVDKGLQAQGTFVSQICVLEPDDTFFPEQPVVLYDEDGGLRSCGFGIVRGEEVYVYARRMMGLLDVAPVNDGVHIVPLRAKMKEDPVGELKPEHVEGPYR